MMRCGIDSLYRKQQQIKSSSLFPFVCGFCFLCGFGFGLSKITVTRIFEIQKWWEKREEEKLEAGWRMAVSSFFWSAHSPP
jgi:hypothetical protein